MEDDCIYEERAGWPAAPTGSNLRGGHILPCRASVHLPDMDDFPGANLQVDVAHRRSYHPAGQQPAPGEAPRLRVTNLHQNDPPVGTGVAIQVGPVDPQRAVMPPGPGPAPGNNYPIPFYCYKLGTENRRSGATSTLD
jgi:hypothetical protein